MRRFWQVILASSFVVSCLQAQDRIYTQYYALPAYLNPALTGGFSNNFQATAIYRDQWRGAIDAPLRNISLNTEFKLPLVNSKNGDAAALGISFSNLKAGIFEWSENALAISGAFHKVLNPKIDQVISAGLQLELNQRNILFEDLTFQDQFNGSDAFDQMTLENLPDNNFGFLNINVGLNYSSNVGEDNHLFVGFAAHNVNGAQVSFYANDSDDPQQIRGNFELGMKYTLHGGFRTELTKTSQLLPRLLVQVQDELLHTLVGSNIRIEQRSAEGQAFHLGSWFRLNRNIGSSIFLDSVGLLAGFEINTFLIGISYDINLYDIGQSYSNRGALEVSFRYRGDYVETSGICPTF